MDRNKVEIQLLQDDPEQLILDYQGMIWIIVRSLVASGKLRQGEQEDLVQEVNKKLLERLNRIRRQYNGSSKLRTYFSVIVRNICLEIIRKPTLVAEPDPEPYETADLFEEPKEHMVIRQEYERLNRVLVLMGQDGAWLNVMLRVMNETGVEPSDLLSFTDYLKRTERVNGQVQELNRLQGRPKKVKFAELARILTELGGKSTPPDSLRKWYNGRLESCLKLMNGDPPRSSFDPDTIGFLIEKLSMKRKK